MPILFMYVGKLFSMFIYTSKHTMCLCMYLTTHAFCIASTNLTDISVTHTTVPHKCLHTETYDGENDDDEDVDDDDDDDTVVSIQ